MSMTGSCACGMGSGLRAPGAGVGGPAERAAARTRAGPETGHLVQALTSNSHGASLVGPRSAQNGATEPKLDQ
jgi:hypothetical protein